MHPNEALINQFYTCFQQKDYSGMQACYTQDACFSDEVFKDLDGRQVRAMWEMLIRRGKNLEIKFRDVSANDQEGKATWIASYDFGPAARPVTNIIHARFHFTQGKISQHTDQFSFYNWSKQALGWTGTLLGWTSFLRKKVQQTAKIGLEDFMKKNNIQ